MQLVYDRHVLAGKNPLGKNSSVFFWYYIALATAGSPWKLLDYSKWIFDEVQKKEDASYYMQVFAYNRMEVLLDGGKLDSKTKEHIEKCLIEASSKYHLFICYSCIWLD